LAVLAESFANLDLNWKIKSNHQPTPNSANFYGNVEIMWKWENSLAQLKILQPVENRGLYTLHHLP